MCNVFFKILREGAEAPRYATEGSAAADLRAVLDSPLTLEPGKSAAVPTGIAIQLPDRLKVALVFARSGLASRHGIALSNGVGVIDSDYRGEVCVLLKNFSDEPYTITNGERIAQLMVTDAIQCGFTEVDELEDTDRGSGGFGSTGNN
ncbi:MAG: dUTP diphosphatase [Oscillospiraceae bacterium]|jgi:dUTP pyrophosphatase